MSFIEIMLVLIFWALVFIGYILFTVTYTLRSLARLVRPMRMFETKKVPVPVPVIKSGVVKLATLVALRYAIRRF